MKRCHKCGWEWPGEKTRPGFSEACPKCRAYLHCCLNCRHHDATRHNECRVPGTDMVADRRGMNYCDAFDFADVTAEGAAPEKQDQARETLAQLFGDDAERADADQAARDFFGAPKPKKDPRTALDDLLGQ
ncbi:MAG TPA: hypothetical protein PKI11_20615 [Candidatus Hydrogenedentes bacterium]|nr:hypothetical protein [Candidatus Hydrogenedentota bacterium]